ncbi:Short-chain dehydrogenase/reductase, conserved site,Short-chain dehydrogenase/reductase SDR,SCP2 sterol- [Cinara cedri]|uniref:Peroxisomal multifunctional enzyme type 2 n=1 Tax=Cinara cedri TaxID=506608 RepID=A0A5E4N7P6_9HEMI|nr:Short-chain dehydrogenase/reductase, conserved site,Short-chain dehydrogenase/reductase SDR,SCP2 sterol- [Cinara cedri]
MDNLRFDGRVVIVTGAGAGLGKAYALLFAERGASVVVNDLGGSRSGDGSSSKAADAVVAEIRAKGGKAVPNYDSVVDGDKLVQTALDNFGRIDIVVNNAGILRDKSFARISESDWNLVHDVHLKGAFKVTQAAWPHFRKQNYGRVIVTSSNSGLYGNFGQANYSAAKLGLVGLCNTMAIEGRKNNINCNVIVPTAASRLTEDILPPDFFAELKPELIAPVVVWLCHENCEENGSIIESAAGWATKCHLVRGSGILLRHKITDMVSPENVRDVWSKLTDMSQASRLNSIEEASSTLLGVIDEIKSGPQTKNENISVFDYTFVDSILYAIGVGANVREESDLQYLYESHENFSTLPTYAILPSLMATMQNSSITNAIPGKEFDLSQVLHGEQYLELHKPLPTEAVLTTEIFVSDVLDKGNNAVIVVDGKTYNESGELIATSQICSFVLSAGGFGGKRFSNVIVPVLAKPNRSPDSTVKEKTSVNQAAIYRLTGDLNPLHIDPSFAMAAGYKVPILHGLATLGMSVRHILKQYANNDSKLFKSLKVRFSKPVVPGQTLCTSMWREENRIHFTTTVLETNTIVLSGAYMELHEVKFPSKPHMILCSGEVEELPSDAVFQGMQERIDSNKSLLKSINGIFLYHITKNGKVASTWTADLKTGKVYRGEPEKGLKVDTTLTISDSDMIDLALGKLNPQMAFMKGKLKIKGNIMLAQKLKALNTESKL